MANDLKLRVLLSAIDQATRPLRAINSGSIGAARALKEARERLKELNAQQKDVSAWRSQRAAAHATAQALSAARDKVKTLSQQFASTGVPTKAMTKDFRNAVHEAQRLKQQHQQQSEHLQRLRTRLHDAGLHTKDLSQHERRLREHTDVANQSIAEQTRRLAALGAQQRRLAAERVTLENQRNVTRSLAEKGAVATASGGAVLYAGAKTIMPGIDFDASMSKVQAITRLDHPSAELTALRKQARSLGGSTQFTAGQAADAQGFLGMAGFEPKAIRAAMPGMLDLASAGGTDLAQTADIASNILSGLGMEAAHMSKLGDVLVGTFTRSNTNLQMLGETMKYAAPMAKTYGVELETAAAMAGKLGDTGLQGSMGGTALSSIMNRLAAPPKAAEKALAQLKIHTADAHSNLRKMPDILKEIHDKTKSLGTTKKGGLLKAIAGEDAVKGMAQLVEQAGTGELQKLIASLRHSQGEATRTARVMADNLKGDLTTLGSAWQDLGIELQDQQDGPLRSLVQSVTEIVRGVKTWAAENPRLAAAIVKTVAIIATLAVVLGSLMVTIASVMLPFVALRLMFLSLGIRLPSLISLLWKLGRKVLPFVGRALLILGRALMLNPIGLAITAIAVAAYLLYENWDAVKQYFSETWKEIKAGFNGGTADILKTLINFSPVGMLYKAFAGVMKYLGIELPGRFTEFGAMIIDGLVKGLKAGFGQLKNVMGEISDSTVGWFKEKLGINSPSRVFAELGGFTMAGLAQGLEQNQNHPTRVLSGLAQQLRAATAAISFEPGQFTHSLTVDDRAPIRTVTPSIQDSHDTYEINIHAAPGMDALAIGRAVRVEMTRIQHEKEARQRSRLADLE